MEVVDELLEKAIKQALANVAMEFDDCKYSEVVIDNQKKLVLKEISDNKSKMMYRLV